jgi:hypothetical protein
MWDNTDSLDTFQTSTKVVLLWDQLKVLSLAILTHDNLDLTEEIRRR